MPEPILTNMENETIERKPLDWKFILIITTALFAYVTLAGMAIGGIGTDIGGFKPQGLTEAIIVAVLLAPLIETAIFQVVPFMVVGIFREKLHDKFKHVYIIFSSLLFAFSHGYSNEYVTLMYVPGIGLAYSYFRAREQNRPAFATATMIHLLYNLVAVLLNHFTEK